MPRCCSGKDSSWQTLDTGWSPALGRGKGRLHQASPWGAGTTNWAETEYGMPTASSGQNLWGVTGLERRYLWDIHDSPRSECNKTVLLNLDNSKDQK